MVQFPKQCQPMQNKLYPSKICQVSRNQAWSFSILVSPRMQLLQITNKSEEVIIYSKEEICIMIGIGFYKFDALN